MSVVERVAIVTGGDRGIGRAISGLLARQGIHVAVIYRKDVEAATQTVKEIESLNRRAIALSTDVTNDEQVAQAVKTTIKTFGKVDILVSNAGVASRGRSVVDSDIDEARRLFDVHVLGAMRFTKLLIPMMREQKRGDVIYISSHATLIYRPFSGPYVMAKAALEAMARTLAKEERENDIRVNVVGPGITETDMGVRMVRARFGVQDVKDAYDKMPFGRLAQPTDIAEMVGYLVSERGSYITGQVIYVNGGGW
jgi:3-oxoacyl-[acyl-carrier protein] reductase